MRDTSLVRLYCNILRNHYTAGLFLVLFIFTDFTGKAVSTLEKHAEYLWSTVGHLKIYNSVTVNAENRLV